MARIDVNIETLAERLAPLAVVGITRLSGGASSLSYAGRLASGGRRVVVKVAPRGVEPILHRDVLRQARVMRALASTAVPVPEVLWEDPGDPPDAPPLFVMSFVEGSSLEPLFDEVDDGEDTVTMAARMRDAARTLSALHAIDPHALSLADEPRAGPVDEIDRWCRTLETVDQALVDGWDEVAAELRRTAPPLGTAAIVHGDFRLGNLLADGATIRAVIDWEIWSVGDPRIDLGWFLVNADPGTYRRPTRYATALPSVGELTDVYADALGCPVPDVSWFRALACFKSTATWSLIVKHNRRRVSPDPALEAMAGVLPTLLDRTRTLLSA